MWYKLSTIEHTHTHTQELQKCEQEKRAHDKEKIECSLKVKELEHKIAKFHKDSRDAAQRVSKPQYTTVNHSTLQ